MAIESNKLIMKFMGERIDPYTRCDFCGMENPKTFPNTRLTKCCSTKKVNGAWEDPSKFFYTIDENTSSIGKATKCTPKVLEYDKDWNLLMGVVEKLEGMGYLTSLTLSSFHIFSPFIEYSPENASTCRYLKNTKIEMVYDTVYESVLKHIQHELSNDSN